MHFQIIQLDTIPIEQMKYPHTFDDATILAETDYVGDEYNSEDRKNFIKDILPNFFEGIATVDPEAETITFLDKDTIKKTILEHFKECISIIERHADDIEFRDKAVWHVGHAFRTFGKYYKFHYLFYHQGYAQTSMDFIEDYAYHPKVMYIGHIIDAHV